jgi:phage terminase small subunit
MKKKLTTKQKRFIEAYNGNGTQAAIKAGYSINAARSIARENLTKPHIKDAINKREDERNSKEIATREQRQELWTDIMFDEEKRMSDRLRASELLAKANGDFSEKTVINIPGLIIRMPELVPVGTPVSYLDDEN